MMEVDDADIAIVATERKVPIKFDSKQLRALTSRYIALSKKMEVGEKSARPVVLTHRNVPSVSRIQVRNRRKKIC